MDTSRPPRLQLVEISKRFPGVRANDRVSLSVNRGEIHCLLGENGAGKTTLMNVLYGLLQADDGEILLDGQRAAIRSPHEAIARGIGMVHQHFTLVPTLTIAENVILGMRPLRALLTDMKVIEQDIAAVAQRHGMRLRPSMLISDLSVGEQQRVEIIKALYRGVDLLVLDEPTAVLTPQETRELFDTLQGLTNQGLSIIFITHKLNEVMAVADRVSVLRDGKMVATVRAQETTQAELAAMMVGRVISFTLPKGERTPGRLVLAVEGLALRSNGGRPLLDNVSLQVHENEILGLAGVDGNGQHELALVISGLQKPDTGRVILCGEDVTGRSPRHLFKAGLGHIPEDRHATGLVLDFSVAYNLFLQEYRDPPFVRGGWLDLRAINDHGQRLVKAYDIRAPSEQTKVAHLSGGNQQKVILAREIDRQPKLLLAVQPTRGLDVGATEYTHHLLLEQRARGGAILLISTELEEVMALSDRIAVIYEGRIMGEVPGGRANVNIIGRMMAGVVAESAHAA